MTTSRIRDTPSTEIWSTAGREGRANQRRRLCLSTSMYTLGCVAAYFSTPRFLVIFFLNSYRRNGESAADRWSRPATVPLVYIGGVLIAGLFLSGFFLDMHTKSKAYDMWEQDCPTKHSVEECDRLLKAHHDECGYQAIPAGRRSFKNRSVNYKAYSACVEVGVEEYRIKQRALRTQ